MLSRIIYRISIESASSSMQRAIWPQDRGAWMDVIELFV